MNSNFAHYSQVSSSSVSQPAHFSHYPNQHIIPQNFTQQILWNDSEFANSVKGNEDSEQEIILPQTYSKTDEQIQSSIEKILGFKIHNIHLYKKAFIHKSMQKTTNCSNERLEFLGDAVLNLIIAEYVYEKYENEDEGFLTKVRTKLVNGQILSEFSKETKLDQIIVYSSFRFTSFRSDLGEVSICSCNSSTRWFSTLARSSALNSGGVPFVGRPAIRWKTRSASALRVFHRSAARASWLTGCSPPPPASYGRQRGRRRPADAAPPGLLLSRAWRPRPARLPHRIATGPPSLLSA